MFSKLIKVLMLLTIMITTIVTPFTKVTEAASKDKLKVVSVSEKGILGTKFKVVSGSWAALSWNDKLLGTKRSGGFYTGDKEADLFGTLTNIKTTTKVNMSSLGSAASYIDHIKELQDAYTEIYSSRKNVTKSGREWKIKNKTSVVGETLLGVEKEALLSQLQGYHKISSPYDSSVVKDHITYPEINFVDDTVYVLDILTIEFFKKFATNKNDISLEDLVRLANNIEDLETDRLYSQFLMPSLNDISKKNKGPKISTLNDLVEYVYKVVDTKKSSVTTSIGQDLINKKYVLPIVVDNLLSDKSANGYDKYKAALYTMTSKISNKEAEKAAVAKIESYVKNVSPFILVQNNNDKDRTMNKLLTKISEDKKNITKDQVNYLYSIPMMRGSLYSDESDNPIQVLADTNVSETNQNATDEAKEVNEQISNVLSAVGNKESDVDAKQMYTISLRLQYHYWGYQTKEVGLGEADSLSSQSNGKIFLRDIEPVQVGDLVNQRQYTMFMNVLNEIPLMREVLMKELGGDILAGNTTTAQVVTNVTYLKQLKNAISFLENTQSEKFKVTPVINYWYEKVTVKGDIKMSLEDLYNKTQELGIKPEDLSKYKTDVKEKPLRNFFSLKEKDINDYLKKGIYHSATYIPMKTNIYDPFTFKSITDDKFYNFHYKYGYYRKALYMDTNVKSAVDRFNTGKIGRTKVATLKDLLEPEKDITLYVDDNLYNVNKLSEIQNKTFDRLDNKNEESKDNFWGQIWDWATDVFSIDVMEITKTSEVESYSTKLKNIKSYAESEGENYGVDKSNRQQTSKNYAVFGKESIDKYVEDDEYSVLQPFAFISSIYRDTDLFNFVEENKQQPVFISSKNLYTATGASDYDKSSIFNYALLKNIENNVLIRYSSTLDMNSPVYMDVYGNILTESGYVVVPAAANATLYKNYSPYTTAFLSTYGSNYRIESTYKDLDKLVNIMEVDTKKEEWVLKDLAVGFTTKVDINRLSTATASSLDTLFKLHAVHFPENFKFDLYVANVFLEVMRGAPLQNIDKDFEGLNTNRDLSRSGILHAVKLDNLKKSLKLNSQNAILSIPNLAFVDNMEYIILFTYKIMIVVCIIMILVQIFIESMRMRAGLLTILGIGSTVMLTLATIFTVPLVFELTYYQSNKAMLQSETEYIAMLNLEKEESGVEIGMTSVGAPNTDTQLLLKVMDLDVPWYDLFYKIIYAPINSNLTKIYEDYFNNNLAVGQEGFEMKSGSLYMDMQDLFDSSSIIFDSSFSSDFSTLYQVTKGKLPASFYTPYYSFLDSLIGDINIYNSENDNYSYTTGTYKGGKLKSLGLIDNYFKSDDFVEDDTSDILNLRQIYGQDMNSEVSTPFEPTDIEAMRKSQWLSMEHKHSDVTERIEKINKEARKFVLDNKDLIGKISDETFLKAMALHLSIYHNKIFGVNSFDNIEIFNLSVDDLTRLSVTDRVETMKGSPLSFTRFIYSEAGETGIYLSAVLSIIIFISGWVKPLVTLIMFGVLFVSFFLYKIILRRKSDNLKGYIKIFLLLCLCNLIYSVLIKTSMMLPGLGIAPSVCILIQIVMHSVFLLLYVFIATISVKNWRDLASNYLNINTKNVRDFFNGNNVRNKIDKELNNDDNTSSGWRTYKRLRDGDKQRKYIIKRGKDEI